MTPETKPNKQSAEIVRIYLVCAMLLSVPFVFYSGPDSFIIPRTMVLELFVWGAALIAAMFPSSRRAANLLVIVVFIFVYLLSTVLSDNPWVSLKTAFLFLSGAALAWVVAADSSPQPRVRKLVWCALVVALVMSVHGIAQYLGVDFQILKGVRFRVFATAGTPAALSGWLAVSLCLLTAMLASASTAGTWLLLSLLWTPIFVCLVFTFSRSGLLAAGLGIIATLGFLLRPAPPVALRALIRVVLASVIAAIIAAVIFAAVSHREQRMYDVVERGYAQQLASSRFKESSLRQRAFVLRSGIHIWRHRPWIGNGPGTFEFHYPIAQAFMIREGGLSKADGAAITNRLATHAHNEYLETAVEAGVFGLCAFLALIVVVLAGFIRGLGKNGDASGTMLRIGAAGGLVALIVQSAFEFTLHDPLTAMLFWVLIGIVSGSVADSAVSRKNLAGGIFRIAAAVMCVAFLFIIPRPYLAMQSAFRAVAAERAGHPSETLRLLDRAHRLDPTEPRLLQSRSAVRRALGDYPAAVRDLSAAMRLSNSPALYSSLCTTYALAANFDRADRACRTAVQIDPWKPDLRFNIAMLSLMKGDTDKAKKELVGILRSDPGYVPARRALMNLGHPGPDGEK